MQVDSSVSEANVVESLNENSLKSPGRGMKFADVDHCRSNSIKIRFASGQASSPKVLDHCTPYPNYYAQRPDIPYSGPWILPQSISMSWHASTGRFRHDPHPQQSTRVAKISADSPIRCVQDYREAPRPRIDFDSQKRFPKHHGRPSRGLSK